MASAESARVKTIAGACAPAPVFPSIVDVPNTDPPGAVVVPTVDVPKTLPPPTGLVILPTGGPLEPPPPPTPAAGLLLIGVVVAGADVLVPTLPESAPLEGVTPPPSMPLEVPMVVLEIVLVLLVLLVAAPALKVPVISEAAKTGIAKTMMSSEGMSMFVFIAVRYELLMPFLTASSTSPQMRPTARRRSSCTFPQTRRREFAFLPSHRLAAPGSLPTRRP